MKIALLALFLTLLAATAVAAQGTSPAAQDLNDFLDETARRGGLTDKAAGSEDALGLVAGIINVILSLTGIIFFAQVFYHGFRWMTAAGGEEIIKESKSGLKQSVIGIVIVFSAFVVSNFVINRLELINREAAIPAVQE